MITTITPQQQVVQSTTRNVFKKEFVLWIIQPVMYFKKILYCGLYNPQYKRCRKYNYGLYNPQCIYFL